jgi:pantoate--beta-alanine ligase
MKIFKDKQSLKKELFDLKSLGFIPTMGSLHKGHEYLIKKARLKVKYTLVSIYINPKQFNSKKDYKEYPRDLQKDLRILRKLKVNYIYLPNYNDIYGFKTVNKIFEDKFIKNLCGKFRKNHFKGVLNVVNRLLEIINPSHIYLGKKDFQQMYLIKKHLLINDIKTLIIPCKTIRDQNGLALSSRNKNLSEEEKILASKVYKLLIKQKTYSVNSLTLSKKIKELKNKIINFGINKIDYIEFLNIQTLKKPSKKDKYNIFIAYYIGSTRLIDNI